MVDKPEHETFSEHLIKEHGVHIDERVRLLVDVLQSLPSVNFISCCGGHKDNIEGQLPADEFFVNLEIEQRRAGWLAIERIVDAIAACGMMGNVELTPWVDNGLQWDLRGVQNADPEELAIAIAYGASVSDFDDDDDEDEENNDDSVVTSTESDGDQEAAATVKNPHNTNRLLN
jgi:hypothetical protein